MNMIKRILNKLNGMHYSREYVCLAPEQHTQALHMLLVENRVVIKDITTVYSMTGICPVIIALPSLTGIDFNKKEIIHVFYTTSSVKKGEIISTKNVIAKLRLKKIKTLTTEQTMTYFFEGKKGSHKFVPSFYQFFDRLNNNLYNNKKGNIFLKGNRYTQIQVVYSVPQLISLITVCKNDLYNVFPTDQHGEICDKYYVIALRHAGKACRQVLDSKNILLSNIDVHQHKEVYTLGKNHMQPLNERNKFNFSETQTNLLHMPIPKNTTEYRELTLVESFIHGIHRILIFEILSHQKITDNSATLSCIHNAYATWRFKNKLFTEHFVF